ncbi:MAG: hypothetical protein ACOYI4_02345 [Christensenellales bacterium]|jgi:hypothetical protein
MNRRAWARIVVLAMLLCLIVGSMPVAAAEGMQVTISAEPVELAQAGTVDLTFLITNTTGANVSDLTIDGPGVSAKNIGNLSAGESLTRPYTAKVNVSADMIGKDLIYKVSWNSEGGGGETNAPVRVKKSTTAKPNLEFSRAVSSKVVAPGSNVEVTYTLRNAGEVDITNILVTDAAFGNSPLQNSATLRAGDPEWSFSRNLTVNSDTRSAPRVTYTADGQSYTMELAPITITAASSGMSLEANVDRPTPAVGDTVTVTCDVINIGNVDINNINLKDEQGTGIKSGFSIKAGERTTIKYTFTAERERSVLLTATGTDASGNTVSAQSSSISVLVQGGEDSSFNLSVTAVPEPGTLTEAGDVTFTITVLNNSDFSLHNLVLKEESIGEIGRLETMGVGEKVFTATAEVSESREFVFILTCTDEQGNTYQERSQPVSVTLETGASPSPSPVTEGSTGSTLLIIFIVIVILIVICGIVFFVLLSQEKKSKRIAAENAKRRMAAAGRRPSPGQTPPSGVPGKPGEGAKDDLPGRSGGRMPNKVIGEEDTPETQPQLIEEEPSRLVEFGPDGQPIEKPVDDNRQ